MNSEESRQKIRTVCLMVVTTAIIGYSIYWLRPVLLPFVVAIFVVSGVTPILQSLEQRLGVSRLIAAGITFLAGLVLLAALGGALWASVLDLADNAPAYKQRIGEIVRRVESFLPSGPPAEEEAEAAVAERQARERAEMRNFLDAVVREGLGRLSQTLVNLVSTSVVVLIYVFFLLLGAAEPVDPGPTWKEIDGQIRSYLGLKTSISIVTGAAFGFALHIFGVPMAITFGVLAFLLNYIPNVGPLVASLLPIPFIVLAPDAGLLWMVAVIGVTSAIQVISGNVVEPKLMGTSSDLHPVVVLLALMFWGMLWGIVGMFLATPITAGIRIILDRIEVTRPVAEVMAGRWQEAFQPRPDAAPSA
ncbi:AI-2 transport protein TqsA [Maioricimonas rarisocia]|uniref:AI-2 transport protein TqsA n=1 Tax=Maioricimonas rarisocia TaxID=2528026 RepID=A0A517ZF57_9PLAN|nr:AI-2E family transporter [Maioricimonas rarisocia]QDU41101.1 AI-2 transport protein TqsA [Maioricimonas rarisocia]